MANKRAEFGFGLGRLEDNYFQSSVIDFSKDRPDKSSYNLYGGSVSISGSTLNARQFATRGYYEKLVAQLYAGKEKYTPGSVGGKRLGGKDHSWLQISYVKEAYHRMTPGFVLGWEVDALYSSKNFSDNYTATMMQAGSFSPTPYSQLTYNESFRANQYVAGGIKPIFVLGDMFHLRGEFYGFMPIYPILRNGQNQAYYGKVFSKMEYMGEISVVCQLPFGAISAYLNHFSSPAREWNVGLSIGWQLFNYRFIE
jgi:NTE family protein